MFLVAVFPGTQGVWSMVWLDESVKSRCVNKYIHTCIPTHLPHACETSSRDLFFQASYNGMYIGTFCMRHKISHFIHFRPLHMWPSLMSLLFAITLGIFQPSFPDRCTMPASHGSLMPQLTFPKNIVFLL